MTCGIALLACKRMHGVGCRKMESLIVAIGQHQKSYKLKGFNRVLLF
jgi:hypothetical protein